MPGGGGGPGAAGLVGAGDGVEGLPDVQVGDLGDRLAGGRIVDVECAVHARHGEIEVGQDLLGVGQGGGIGVGESAHGGHLASWAVRTVSMAATSCRISSSVVMNGGLI